MQKMSCQLARGRREQITPDRIAFVSRRAQRAGQHLVGEVVQRTPVSQSLGLTIDCVPRRWGDGGFGDRRGEGFGGGLGRGGCHGF